MNELLIKREINESISKDEFHSDILCLFKNLEESYGLYEYFGKERFDFAKDNILKLEYKDLDSAISYIREQLSFIKDGHFFIGKPKEIVNQYDYAITYSTYKGVKVIDCKKFYYDNDKEREELEFFEKNVDAYRNNDPLILDLRDNHGGSSLYIYNFLVNLLQNDEIGYSFKLLERNSKLIEDAIGQEYLSDNPDVWVENKDNIIKNNKRIYVLFNENSASASEEALAYFRNMENVILVGSHSNGSFSCGNCISIYLPNSHLEVYFGTSALLYFLDDKYVNIDSIGGFKGDISIEDFDKLIFSKC